MKFGKVFERELVPTWRQHYIQYNELKQWIKEVEARHDDDPEGGSAAAAAAAADASDSKHFNLELEAQVNHVMDFYEEQRQTIEVELVAAERQRALLGPAVPAVAAVAAVAAVSTDTSALPSPVRSSESVASSSSSASTSAGGSVGPGLQAASLQAATLAQFNRERLLQEYHRQGEYLLQIFHFLQLNSTALRKILKKFAKRLRSQGPGLLEKAHVNQDSLLGHNLKRMKDFSLLEPSVERIRSAILDLQASLRIEMAGPASQLGPGLEALGALGTLGASGGTGAGGGGGDGFGAGVGASAALQPHLQPHWLRGSAWSASPALRFAQYKKRSNLVVRDLSLLHGRMRESTGFLSFLSSQAAIPFSPVLMRKPSAILRKQAREASPSPRGIGRRRPKPKARRSALDDSRDALDGLPETETDDDGAANYSHDYGHDYSHDYSQELGLDTEDSDGSTVRSGDADEDRASQYINLASTFFYLMNYNICLPTSSEYAQQLGLRASLSGVIVAMTPVAALLSAVGYSMWSNRSFKAPLLCSSLCLVVGNLMYAMAWDADAAGLALAGRFVCGLGGCRAVNRRYIADTISLERRTVASAAFVAAGALGMAMGPLAASVFDGVDSVVPLLGITANEMTAPALLMSAVWVGFLCATLAFFTEPSVVLYRQSDAGSYGYDDDGGSSSGMMKTGPLDMTLSAGASDPYADGGTDGGTDADADADADVSEVEGSEGGRSRARSSARSRRRRARRGGRGQGHNHGHGNGNGNGQDLFFDDVDDFLDDDDDLDDSELDDASSEEAGFYAADDGIGIDIVLNGGSGSSHKGHGHGYGYGSGAEDANINAKANADDGRDHDHDHDHDTERAPLQGRKNGGNGNAGYGATASLGAQSLGSRRHSYQALGGGGGGGGIVARRKQRRNRLTALCLWLIFLVKLVQESMLTAMPLVLPAFYAWRPATIGVVMTLLGLSVVPFNVIVVALSHAFGLKDAFWIKGLQLPMLVAAVALVSASDEPLPEWRMLLGCFGVFVASQIMEAVVTAYFSKVIDPSLAAGTFNSGLLATEAGTLGRAAGNAVVSVLGLGSAAVLQRRLYAMDGVVTLLTLIVTVKMIR